MADMSGEAPVENNRLNVYKYLKEKNLRPEVISGLMGNIAVETGDTFDFQEIQGKDDTGPGYGLFQFDYMKPFYKDHLKKNKLKDSIKTQVDWTLEQINNPKTSILGSPKAKELKNIMDKGDVVQVTDGFMNIFENPSTPHRDRRVRSALEIYNNLMQRKHGGMVMRNYYDYEPRSI